MFWPLRAVARAAGDFPPRSTAGLFTHVAATLTVVPHCCGAGAACAARSGARFDADGGDHRRRSAPTTSRGPSFDAGKRINGRKRHIVTDTDGLLLAHVHPAKGRCTAPSRCWSGCAQASQAPPWCSPTASTAAIN